MPGRRIHLHVRQHTLRPHLESFDSELLRIVPRLLHLVDSEVVSLRKEGELLRAVSGEPVHREPLGVVSRLLHRANRKVVDLLE